VKIGRYEFDINEKDVILDNGACYQLITRRGRLVGWDFTTPIISKTQFEKLRKGEMVYTDDELRKRAEERYKCKYVRYWVFNVPKIKEAGL
jgi:hypothetical protein